MHLLLMLLAWLWASPAIAESGWVQAPDEAAVIKAMEAPLPSLPAGTEWVEHTTPYATVYAGKADEAVSLHLTRYTADSLPRLAQEMGLAIGNRVHIYIAPDQDTFLTMQPGVPPAWADGTAWPHRGLVFLRSPRIRGGTADPLEQVLDHELAHILLGRAFGARRPPRWLQEGVAQLVAREYTPALTDRIGQGMFGDNLLHLDDLVTGFPTDPLRARLAYAQSADLVAYIKSRFGDDSIHVIIREMAAGRAYGAAIRAATGMGSQELDQAWRAELGTSPLWLRPMVSDTMILTAAGLVFIVLGAASLHRRRLRMAELIAEEAREDALYAQLSQWDIGAHRPPSGGYFDGAYGTPPERGPREGPALHKPSGMFPW